MYTRHFDRLHLCGLSPEQHARTCGYWYTVTEGSTAHTAFATERGLRLWLDQLGLSIAAPLPERGVWSSQPIIGTYSRASHMNVAEFRALPGAFVFVLDNGDYTEGCVTTATDGRRTLHHLNCNVSEREVYDHQLTRAIVDGVAASGLILDRAARQSLTLDRARRMVA